MLNGILKKPRVIFTVSLILLALLLAVLAVCIYHAQSAFKVDGVDTASNVTITGGVRDWQKYVLQESFPSGYSGEFWVMFSFSNMLHDGKTHVKVNIYILSNGELIAEENKEANLTDSSDNKLWWGNMFDISSYADGDYSAIVTVTDLIAGTSASLATTFKIGAAP
jgi:hypothetical protein